MPFRYGPGTSLTLPDLKLFSISLCRKMRLFSARRSGLGEMVLNKADILEPLRVRRRSIAVFGYVISN